MKRLIIETDKQVIIEYHLNMDAARTRLPYYLKTYKVLKWDIKDVIKHVETLPQNEPNITLKRYSAIK